MKKNWYQFWTYLWFLVLSVIVCSIYNKTVGLKSGYEIFFASVLFGLVVILVIYSGNKIYEDFLRKISRVKKYGKYLKAANLPEDIKDVLGKFISFSINYENNSSLVITEKIIMIEFSPSDNMNSVLDIFFEPRISSSSDSNTQDMLTIEEVKGSFNVEISFNGNIEKPGFIKIL